MDSWRQKFIDARDRLQDDEDDDDFALRWDLELLPSLGQRDQEFTVVQSLEKLKM